MSDAHSFEGLTSEESEELRNAQAPEPEEEDAPPEKEEKAAPAEAEPEEEEESAFEDPKAKAEKKKTQFVPHAKFHEEYKRRTNAEQRLKTFEEAWQRYQTQQQQPQYQPPGPQQYQPPPQQAQPDVDEDPRGFVVDIAQQVRQLREHTEQQTQAQIAQQQQVAYEQRLEGRYQAERQEVVRQLPDFDDAIQHVVNVRHQQLAALGVGDPNLRQQQVNREYLDLLHRTYNQGRSAALTLYEYARTVGYAPRTGANPTKQPVDIDTVRRGQEASKSISSVGSSGARSISKTEADLDAMSPAQLDKWIASNPDGFKKLVMRSAPRG